MGSELDRDDRMAAIRFDEMQRPARKLPGRLRVVRPLPWAGDAQLVDGSPAPMHRLPRRDLFEQRIEAWAKRRLGQRRHVDGLDLDLTQFS